MNTEVVCNRHAKEAMPAGENKRVARERGENQERRQRTTEATEACSLLQRRQVNQEVKTLVGLYSYLLQCT